MVEARENCANVFLDARRRVVRACRVALGRRRFSSVKRVARFAGIVFVEGGRCLLVHIRALLGLTRLVRTCWRCHGCSVFRLGRRRVEMQVLLRRGGAVRRGKSRDEEGGSHVF